MYNNIDIDKICQEFSQTLNGTIISKDNYSCKIIRPRNLIINILGRRANVSAAPISFESMDTDGIALNLGDAALLPEEVDPFVFTLLSNGIIVGAVHNHWLFSDPIIMYVHFESIDNPLAFAIKVEEAFLSLRR